MKFSLPAFVFVLIIIFSIALFSPNISEDVSSITGSDILMIDSNSNINMWLAVLSFLIAAIFIVVGIAARGPRVPVIPRQITVPEIKPEQTPAVKPEVKLQEVKLPKVKEVKKIVKNNLAEAQGKYRELLDKYMSLSPGEKLKMQGELNKSRESLLDSINKQKQEGRR